MSQSVCTCGDLCASVCAYVGGRLLFYSGGHYDRMTRREEDSN